MHGSVLIVDDDPAFRRLAAEMLAAAGLTVAGEAGDAAGAVAAALELSPGGILVDIGLPDRTGADLARELLALPWRPRLLLTSADRDASQCAEGLIRFVAKEDLPNVALRSLLGSGEAHA